VANILSQLSGGQQLPGGGLQNLGSLNFLGGQLQQQTGGEGLTPGILQLLTALQGGGLSGAAGIPGLAGTATSALEGKDSTQSLGILQLLGALGR